MVFISIKVRVNMLKISLKGWRQRWQSFKDLIVSTYRYWICRTFPVNYALLYGILYSYFLWSWICYSRIVVYSTLQFYFILANRRLPRCSTSIICQSKQIDTVSLLVQVSYHWFFKNGWHSWQQALFWLTLSHPEALHWQVKSSGIRQSKITKGTILASLGQERLSMKRMGI